MHIQLGRRYMALSNSIIHITKNSITKLNNCVQLLQGGVGGISGDATLVVLVSGHHDVALVSPVLAPTVYWREREKTLTLQHTCH